jgi:hypothetical protein
MLLFSEFPRDIGNRYLTIPIYFKAEATGECKPIYHIRVVSKASIVHRRRETGEEMVATLPTHHQR